MESKIFIYQNAKGNVTSRDVNSISESGMHIQGVCSKANSLRTFRKDRILEYISDYSSLEERLHYWIKNAPSVQIKSTTPRNWTTARDARYPDICFTGFKSAEKGELKESAKKFGLIIRSSVTLGLHCLVYGKTAGSKKMEKAREQGVLIITEGEFRELVKTGEVPSE